jgi:hypothetical protein
VSIAGSASAGAVPVDGQRRNGADLVGETAGRRDHGSLATPHRNLLVDNANYPTCRGH